MKKRFIIREPEFGLECDLSLELRDELFWEDEEEMVAMIELGIRATLEGLAADLGQPRVLWDKIADINIAATNAKIALALGTPKGG